MCFSAGASFGASAVLTVVGIVAIRKAKTNPEVVFASTPLLFALQQVTEGVIWLSLKNENLAAYQSVFTYTYLFFAMMVWPAWIPFTMRILEEDAGKKKVLNILFSAGITVALGIGLVLFFYPVQVVGMHHHLHYSFGFPEETKNFIWLFTILYFLTSIVPPFISSVNRMKWLGVAFLVAYFFSIFFYKGFVVSVWCYFAALLSIVIIWIIAGKRKNDAVNRFRKFYNS